jgi:hypothetical protein
MKSFDIVWIGTGQATSTVIPDLGARADFDTLQLLNGFAVLRRPDELFAVFDEDLSASRLRIVARLRRFSRLRAQHWTLLSAAECSNAARVRSNSARPANESRPSSPRDARSSQLQDHSTWSCAVPEPSPRAKPRSDFVHRRRQPPAAGKEQTEAFSHVSSAPSVISWIDQQSREVKGSET